MTQQLLLTLLPPHPLPLRPSVPPTGWRQEFPPRSFVEKEVPAQRRQRRIPGCLRHAARQLPRRWRRHGVALPAAKEEPHGRLAVCVCVRVVCCVCARWLRANSALNRLHALQLTARVCMSASSSSSSSLVTGETAGSPSIQRLDAAAVRTYSC